jgi:hypothetical protein
VEDYCAIRYDQVSVALVDQAQSHSDSEVEEFKRNGTESVPSRYPKVLKPMRSLPPAGSPRYGYVHSSTVGSKALDDVREHKWKVLRLSGNPVDCNALHYNREVTGQHLIS